MNFIKRIFVKRKTDAPSIKIKNIAAIVIADTHGFAKSEENILQKIEHEPYDACFILGDCEENDIQCIIKYINAEKTYGVYGNHDSGTLYEKYGIININGKVITIKGKTFAGWEGSVKYKPSAIGMTQEESLAFADTLPNADYLISHDGLFDEKCGNLVHQGLKGITKYQKRTGCYILRGHIHSRYENEHERCFYGIEKCTL